MASVLALGLDPRFADLTSMPGLTPELIQTYIDSQLARMRVLRYEVDSCLVPHEIAEQSAEFAHLSISSANPKLSTSPSVRHQMHVLQLFDLLNSDGMRMEDHFRSTIL